MVERRQEPPRTVLIVDDDKPIRDLMVEILKDELLGVHTAESGEKGLEELRRDDLNVGLVITDLKMPGMGGREFVRRLRGEISPTLPVIVFSGGLLADVDEETLSLTQGFLHKPFNVVDLLDRVNEHLPAPRFDPNQG